MDRSPLKTDAGGAQTNCLVQTVAEVMRREPALEAVKIDRAQRWIREAPTAREGLQDLLWALLNSREFLFNH